jgi:integrase
MSEFEDFREYLEEKRKRVSRDNLTPITVETYLYLTEDLFKRADLYNPKNLVEWMNDRLKQRKNTVMYAAYKNILSFLGYQKYKLDLVKPEMPRSALKSIKFLQSKVLAVSELKQFVEGMPDLWGKMIILCFYDGALRKEEFLRLKVPDIHFLPFDNKHPNFPGAEVNLLGKGSKRRQVYFSHETCKLVKQWIAEQKLDKDDFLFRFLDSEGKPYKQQNFLMWKFLIQSGERILNRHTNPHSLRHTKATHLAADGAELLAISRYLGHSDVRITMIYIEISPFLGRKVWTEHSFDIMKTR